MKRRKQVGCSIRISQLPDRTHDVASHLKFVPIGLPCHDELRSQTVSQTESFLALAVSCQSNKKDDGYRKQALMRRAETGKLIVVLRPLELIYNKTGAEFGAAG